MDIEGFKIRLKEIMSRHNMTPATFSESIGIQRSILSHILSGRNRPSLEVVLKIIEKFTDVNLYWLIYGNDPLLVKTSDSSILPPTTIDLFASPPLPASDTPKLADSSQSMPKSVHKSIDKMMLIYLDKTFDVYHFNQ